MRRKKENGTLTPELLDKMAEMWKRMYAAGKIDSPFNRQKFDFLAKLFAGKATAGQQKRDE